jgi:hypothetical protein
MRPAPVASITRRSKPSATPQVPQRCQEILVDRIALAMDALFLGHLRFEAAALFVGVGQLAEAVGKFHAANIKLEAFGHARIVRARARQRRLVPRIAVEHRGPAQA